jgi:YVTN family beta-propeller protein
MRKIVWLLICTVVFLTTAFQMAADATSVIATVDVGSYPRGIAVNPNTDRIYVVGEYSEHLSAINGVTNSVVATIPLNGKGWTVAVNPTTNRIYCVVYNYDNPPYVLVIDGETNSVIASIPSPRTGASGAIAVNPATNRIYWTHPSWTSNNISVIDGTTNTIIHTFGAGSGLYDVAVNPITNRIYVLRMYEDSILVLNGNTDSVVDVVQVGDFPYGVAVDTITNRIYVSNGYSDNVSVIDGVSNSVVATIPVAVQGGVEVNPYSDHIYVGHYSDIRVVDVATNSVIDTITVGRMQTGFAVNPSTNRLYASDYWGSRVLVISDEADVLQHEWILPEKAFMGQNYQVILRVINPTSALQTVSFSLDQEPEIDWNKSWLSDFKSFSLFNNELYIIGEDLFWDFYPNNTVDLPFTFNNKWNWINPNPSNTELLSILAVGLSLPETKWINYTGDLLGLILDLFAIYDIFNVVSKVDYNFYEYFNTPPYLPGLSTSTIEVPKYKIAALVTNTACKVWGVARVGRGALLVNKALKENKRYLLELGRDYMLTGAFFELLANPMRQIAGDPQPEYQELAIPSDVPLPIQCFSNEWSQADSLSTLKGYLDALALSYIRFDAAEDAESGEWMVLHASAIQNYTEKILSLIQMTYVPLPEDISNAISLADIEETRESLFDNGLPQEVACLFSQWGYSLEELETVSHLLADANDDYFIGDLDQIMLTQTTGMLHQMKDELPMPESAIVVKIDVKPGSDPNCFNINGHGVVPVAILGTADFDVSNINATTLSFNGLKVRVRGKGPLCSTEDVNEDGHFDLVCQFEDDPDNWMVGNAMAGLTGVLADETTIIGGIDSICIVPQ